MYHKGVAFIFPFYQKNEIDGIFRWSNTCNFLNILFDAQILFIKTETRNEVKYLVYIQHCQEKEKQREWKT